MFHSIHYPTLFQPCLPLLLDEQFQHVVSWVSGLQAAPADKAMLSSLAEFSRSLLALPFPEAPLGVFDGIWGLSNCMLPAVSCTRLGKCHKLAISSNPQNSRFKRMGQP